MNASEIVSPKTPLSKLCGVLSVAFLFVLFAIDGVFFLKLHINPEAAFGFVCMMEPYTFVANLLIRPDLLVYAQKQCPLSADPLVAKLLYLKFKIMLCVAATIFHQILQLIDFLIAPSSILNAAQEVEEKAGFLKYSKSFFTKTGPVIIAAILLLIGFPMARNMSDFAEMERTFLFLGPVFFYIAIMVVSTWVITVLAYLAKRKEPI